MRRSARIAAWTLLGAGALAVALLASALPLARWVASDAVRTRILDAASREAGGPVTFERVDLVLVPRPGVVVRRPAVAIPGTLAGTAESLAVFPEVLPLFTGTFRPARIEAKAPSFRVRVPATVRKAGEAPLSLARIEDRIASLLAHASSRAPALAVSIRDGRLDLSDDGGTLVSFRDVAGRVKLPPDALTVRIACRSELFERLSATAILDPKAFRGRGRIEVARFRPRSLAAWLVPGLPMPGAADVVDVAVAVRAGGPGVIEADVDGSASSLDLSRGSRRRTLESVRFSGTVREDRGTATVALRELALGSPKLALSGRLLLDRLTPRAAVDAEIRDADLASLRGAAIALAGDVPAVRRFFDVVRGGRLPSAAVRLRAGVPEELADPGNIDATARLTDGAIHVPGIDLDLASARGEVSFAAGILRGRGLSADVGKSRGSNGTLTLGMTGRTRVLRLDATIRADLSELPALLARLIGTESARSAISGIEESRGAAEGRLVLDGTTASVATRVDVAQMRLFARHRGVPFPVTVSRGRLSYGGNAVAVADLDGTAGRSSFAGLAGRLSLGGEPAIDVSSGRFALALGELHPWLATLEGIRDVLDGIGTLEGTANVAVARLQGPPSKPRLWRYDVSGDVKGLDAVTAGAPGRVEIVEGRFSADRESLSFSGVRGRILDATLSASGSLRGPGGDGGRGYDLSLDGTIGAEAAAWLSDLFRVPRGLRVRSPLSLSGGRLSRSADGGTSFRGTLAFRDGPVVVVALRKDAGGLDIDRLAVRDAESDAAIALRLRGTEASATFRGTLTQATVGRIYPANPQLRGQLAGSFAADIRLDRPADSSARGTLEGRHLVVPLPGGDSLAIETVSLDAQGGSIRVNPTAVAWRGQRLSLEGALRFDASGARVDLDLASESLDADAILAGLAPTVAAGARESLPPGAEAGADRPPGRLLDDIPVSGNLRVKAKHVRSGRYTWSPFDADIAFSRDYATVTLADAAVCGIATTGSLTVTPHDLSIDIRVPGASGEIGPVLECLTGTKYGATGGFTFRGHAAGRGAPGTIVGALKGEFAFEARKGRIRRLNLLAKILAVVNVTELFRGKVPDLGKSGFAYDAIKAAGTIEGGKIVLKDGANLDGRSMGIVAHGDIDLRSRNVDLVALVAPLRTVDAIIRRIPIVRHILGGSLVSIPVAVRGNIDDPAISALPPSEIGKGMLGFLERILKAPVKLVEPVIGGLGRTRSGDHQGYPQP